MEGLLALRGVVLAALLGPEVFGVWAVFRLALRYAGFADLGIQRGVELEVSGREDAAPWGRAAVGYLATVLGALGLASFAVSFFVEDPWTTVLRALAFALLVQRLWSYGSSYLRAAGHLRRFAVVELVQAALSVALAGGLTLVWRLPGALTGYVGAMAISVGLLGRTLPLRPSWDRERLRRLLGVGIPLSLAGVAGTLLATADRLIVVGFEGTEALGYYAFAVAVSGVGGVAALVVRTVVFPDVYTAARREGGETAARAHLRDTLIPFTRLLPPLLGLVALALGPAIAIVVPEYAEVVPVARLFIFTGLATGFTGLGTLGVVATDRQRLLPLLSVGGLVLNVLLAVAALRLGWGLAGVAAGALLSRSLTGVAVVVVSTAGGDDGSRVRGALRTTFDLLWPLVWCAGAVALVGLLRPDTGIVATAGSVLLYLVVLLPLAPAIVREARRQRRFERGTAGR